MFSISFSRFTPICIHGVHAEARTSAMNASSQNARCPRLRNRIFLRLRRRSWHCPRALSFRNFLPSRDSSATSMGECTRLHEEVYARWRGAASAKSYVSHAYAHGVRTRKRRLFTVKGDQNLSLLLSIFSLYLSLSFSRYKEINVTVATRDDFIIY